MANVVTDWADLKRTHELGSAQFLECVSVSREDGRGAGCGVRPALMREHL